MVLKVVKQSVILLFTLGVVLFLATIRLRNDDTVLEKPFDLTSDLKVNVTEGGVVKEISLEEYVVGVLAGEMPVYFEFEALKAQAVASRTYILKKISYNKDYVTTGTINDQVYKSLETLKSRWNSDYALYINKLRQAVYDTKDEYMTYEGKVIEALFFSTSNGSTEDSENYFSFYVPYLRRVEVPWDEQISPKYFSDKTVTKEDFLNVLEVEDSTITLWEEYPSGRVKSVTIGSKNFSGKSIRTLFGLQSSDFIIQVGEDVTFFVEGFGHGVGMSQYGAEGMAQEGYAYHEILRYFYRGIDFDYLKEASK